MTVLISDIEFDPDVYATYMQEDDTHLNAFVASGAVVVDPMLSARAAGEADTTTIPYWNDLDNDNENISSDDPNSSATPEGITTSKMRARTIHINNAWQTANMAAEVSSKDPMAQISSRTNNYWVNRLSIRVNAMMTGMFLENEAGTGDMIYDISSETGSTATDANKFSREAFVYAIGTMGEHASDLALMAVRPEVMTTLRLQNEIITLQDADTGIMINMYGDLRVIEDKRLPAIAGGVDGFRYVTAIYATGAFGLGQAMAKRPVAVEYDELAGDGAGIETLVERKQMIIHPAGYDWTETTVAGQSPTVAECALPANYARKFERENVPLAWLVTNG
jgi:hypothetical protein